MAETATAGETATATETETAATTRFALPDGIVAPIGLKNALVKQGKAPRDIKPQMFYTFVTNPGKADPFPVKHYTEDGTAYDQKGGPDGTLNTRPGLVLDEGVAWWDRRKARQADKATAATTETAATPAPADVTAAQAEEPGAEDEGFTEAE